MEALESRSARRNGVRDARLTFSFTRNELDNFTSIRLNGLAEKSHDWIKRASQDLWESTKGEISQQSVTQLRTFALEKYSSADSHSKVLSFAKSFLKFLATTKEEPRYQTFAPYLELPKTVKERKSVTSRIVTKDDINNVLQHIAKAEREGVNINFQSLVSSLGPKNNPNAFDRNEKLKAQNYFRGFNFFCRATRTCGGTNALTSPPSRAISFTMRELKNV